MAEDSQIRVELVEMNTGIGNNMFLCDIHQANFAEKKPETVIEKKVGLLKRGSQLVLGKTPMGTLTRAAGLGGLYGINRIRKGKIPNPLNKPINRFRLNEMKQGVMKGLTSNTAKTIAGSAVGTVAGGLALNEGRKLYEKKTRKWWEVL